MNLYLLRHAQSVGNMTGDYSTVAHDNLSELGQSQADALSSVINKSFSVDEIFVSPYGRAMQTIAPYLQSSNRKACVWGNLAEACWQTDVSAEIPIRTGQPDQIDICDSNIFLLDNFSGAMPFEDETFAEGQARVDKTGNEILRRYLGRPVNIFLVTHAYFASRLIEKFVGIKSGDTTWFDFDNCGLTLLEERTAEKFFVRYHNRISLT